MCNVHVNRKVLASLVVNAVSLPLSFSSLTSLSFSSFFFLCGIRSFAYPIEHNRRLRINIELETSRCCRDTNCWHTYIPEKKQQYWDFGETKKETEWETVFRDCWIEMKRGHMIRLSGFSTLDIHLPDESIAKRNYVNPFPTN